MTLRLLTALFACTMSLAASAQAMFFNTARVADSTDIVQTTRKAFETPAKDRPVAEKTARATKIPEILNINSLTEDELEYWRCMPIFRAVQKCAGLKRKKRRSAT